MREYAPKNEIRLIMHEYGISVLYMLAIIVCKSLVSDELR